MSLTFLPFLIFAGIILFSTFKILNEYERGVIFRLGKFSGVRGPGLIILVPGLEKMVKLETGDVFFAGVGCEHVAHPVGEARILVVEREGSV